jgi:hypothetical protein
LKSTRPIGLLGAIPLSKRLLSRRPRYVVLARIATETMVYMGCMQARLDRAKRMGLRCLPTSPEPWFRGCPWRRMLDKNMDMVRLAETSELNRIADERNAKFEASEGVKDEAARKTKKAAG